MGKLNITIQTASNGVYFTHDGETLVFTDPTLLGDHLFDLALDAENKPDTQDLYITGVPIDRTIPQIKLIRSVTGWDLRSSKDACDKARTIGAHVLLVAGADESQYKEIHKELDYARRNGYDNVVVDSFVWR